MNVSLSRLRQRLRAVALAMALAISLGAAPALAAFGAFAWAEEAGPGTPEAAETVSLASLVDGLDDDATVAADDECVLKATVALDGLTPAAAYELEATLVNADDGSPLPNAETPIATTVPLTADGATLGEPVSLNFDGTALEAPLDATLGLTLKREGAPVATLAVPGEGETPLPRVSLVKPSLTGVLVEPADGALTAAQESTALWTLSATDVAPSHTYDVTLGLIDAKTGQPVMSGGEPIAAALTLEGAAPTGLKAPLGFDSSPLTGMTLGCEARLMRHDKVLATWTSPEDASFDVVTLSMETALRDGVDGDDELTADPAMELIDTINYERLGAHETVRAFGIVMDPATGLPLLVGDPDQAPDEAELTEYFVQLMDAFGLRNYVTPEPKTAESSETTAGDGGSDTAAAADESREEDANVADDTGTGEDETAEGDVSTSSPESDAVAGLTTPTTIDAEALETLLADTNELRQAVAWADESFTPEPDAGSTDLRFTFDGSCYGRAHAAQELAVITVLTADDQVIAAETDLERAGHVTITPPEVSGALTPLEAQEATHSTATIDADDGPVALVDAIRFDNVVSDVPYVVKTTLVDKESGQDIAVDEQPVEGTASFTPEDTSGTQSVTITVDPSSLAGQTIVAREELYRDGTLVASQEAPSDADEGVTVVNEQALAGSTYAKTGALALAGIVGGALACGSGSAAIGWYLWRRRRI